LDSNGKTVFMVGCGHAFVVHAVYPGAPKKDEAEATSPSPFVQWDLGYPRQGPGLYEKKWHQLENRLFDLLDAGPPLTISAEGKSYVLPAVDAPQWRRRFQKIC